MSRPPRKAVSSSSGKDQRSTSQNPPGAEANTTNTSSTAQASSFGEQGNANTNASTSIQNQANTPTTIEHKRAFLQFLASTSIENQANHWRANTPTTIEEKRAFLQFLAQETAQRRGIVGQYYWILDYRAKEWEFNHTAPAPSELRRLHGMGRLTGSGFIDPPRTSPQRPANSLRLEAWLRETTIKPSNISPEINAPGSPSTNPVSVPPTAAVNTSPASMAQSRKPQGDAGIFSGRAVREELFETPEGTKSTKRRGKTESAPRESTSKSIAPLESSSDQDRAILEYSCRVMSKISGASEPFNARIDSRGTLFVWNSLIPDPWISDGTGVGYGLRIAPNVTSDTVASDTGDGSTGSRGEDDETPTSVKREQSRESMRSQHELLNPETSTATPEEEEQNQGSRNIPDLFRSNDEATDASTVPRLETVTQNIRDTLDPSFPSALDNDNHNNNDKNTQDEGNNSGPTQNPTVMSVRIPNNFPADFQSLFSSSGTTSSLISSLNLRGGSGSPEDSEITSPPERTEIQIYEMIPRKLSHHKAKIPSTWKAPKQSAVKKEKTRKTVRTYLPPFIQRNNVLYGTCKAPEDPSNVVPAQKISQAQPLAHLWPMVRGTSAFATEGSQYPPDMGEPSRSNQEARMPSSRSPSPSLEIREGQGTMEVENERVSDQPARSGNEEPEPNQHSASPPTHHTSQGEENQRDPWAPLWYTFLLNTLREEASQSAAPPSNRTVTTSIAEILLRDFQNGASEEGDTHGANTAHRAATMRMPSAVDVTISIATILLRDLQNNREEGRDKENNNEERYQQEKAKPNKNPPSKTEFKNPPKDNHDHNPDKENDDDRAGNNPGGGPTNSHDISDYYPQLDEEVGDEKEDEAESEGEEETTFEDGESKKRDANTPSENEQGKKELGRLLTTVKHRGSSRTPDPELVFYQDLYIEDSDEDSIYNDLYFYYESDPESHSPSDSEQVSQEVKLHKKEIVQRNEESIVHNSEMSRLNRILHHLLSKLRDGDDYGINYTHKDTIKTKNPPHIRGGSSIPPPSEDHPSDPEANPDNATETEPEPETSSWEIYHSSFEEPQVAPTSSDHQFEHHPSDPQANPDDATQPEPNPETQTSPPSPSEPHQSNPPPNPSHTPSQPNTQRIQTLTTLLINMLLIHNLQVQWEEHTTQIDGLERRVRTLEDPYWDWDENEDGEEEDGGGDIEEEEEEEGEEGGAILESEGDRDGDEAGDEKTQVVMRGAYGSPPRSGHMSSSQEEKQTTHDEDKESKPNITNPPKRDPASLSTAQTDSNQEEEQTPDSQSTPKVSNTQTTDQTLLPFSPLVVDGYEALQHYEPSPPRVPSEWQLSSPPDTSQPSDTTPESHPRPKNTTLKNDDSIIKLQNLLHQIATRNGVSILDIHFTLLRREFEERGKTVDRLEEELRGVRMELEGVRGEDG
ncbi:hypothetical protein HYALB_00012918 [Hymenoscyphus albidus]|uniref:Uncharacterized protein n=1 Tax=Hymenoscyphus albidus TaxID=595503 RepID=A0A9N9LLN4_9HELO|nr:hypothetical protein HYALB_00012918 [Hymenoscyphus albidus]